MKHISPLRYPGGKAKIAPAIRDIIRNNFSDKLKYCEPFAGGAGIAFKLLEWDIVSEVIINDLDENVYSFWYSILHFPDKFIEMIRRITVSVPEWKNQKKILYEETDPLKKGFAFFYLNRCNRSGIIRSNPIGGINQNGTYKIDARFNKSDLIRRIEVINKFQSKIHLTNLDGLEILNCMDDHTFYFLDPPYFVQGRNLYSDFFDSDKHNDLSEILLNNKKKKWVLTYDIADTIKELYESFNMKQYPLTYSLANKKKAHEYMILSEAIS